MSLYSNFHNMILCSIPFIYGLYGIWIFIRYIDIVLMMVAKQEPYTS